MPAPDKISLEPEEATKADDEYIIGHVKGHKTFFTRYEAVSLINELSGVLLADECSGRHTASPVKYG